MNNVGRYTIFIFLGFLIALVILMGLANMFKQSDSKKDDGGKVITDRPAVSANGEVVNSGGETSSGGVTEIATDIINTAKKDVSTLTQKPISEITVLRQENVEWPDSSLGCPKQGFLYSQVITPGYKITLETDSELFVYHTDTKGTVVLCENTQKEVE